MIDRRAQARGVVFAALVTACGGDAPRSTPAPAPVPASAPAPVPASVPAPTTEQIAALAAADAASPVRIEPAAIGELTAPSNPAPTRIGGPAPAPARYPALVDGFVVDANDDIYVLDDEAGELVVQPGGDASAARVLARLDRTSMRHEQLFDLVLDGDAVIFTTTLRSFDGSEAVFGIRRVAKRGGPAEVLQRGEVAGGVVDALAVDADALYWHRIDSAAGERGGTIVRAARTPGAPATTVLRGVAGFYAWALQGPEVVAFVERESAGAGAIVRVPVQGGEASTLVQTPDAVGAIAVGALGIVYSQRTDDPERLRVDVIDRDAEAPRELASYDGFPTSLVLDGETVYWNDLPPVDSDDLTQSIRARAWRGGAAREVARELPRGAHWDVVRRRLYWSGETGVVARALE